MRHGFSLVAAAAAAFASPASAQSWTEVQRTKDGVVVYFDAAGAARTGSRVRVTLRYDMPESYDAAYGIAQTELDCAARTARIVEMTNYRAGGEVVNRFGGTEPDPIRDGTAWATVADAVCTAPSVS
ncbi:MAG TPA: surface-adhesin E family protein [Allosphingosinicella sp.]|jgi:hypothetical protein